MKDGDRITDFVYLVDHAIVAHSQTIAFPVAELEALPRVRIVGQRF
ncbi:MAG: hypothetical protein L0G70_04850 [Rubrobacter sp.]|nr:hypothetical protein [Rubrobacter sp.]